MAYLKLLGGVTLEIDAGPVTGPAAQRRRLALLSRLALAGGQGVTRDKLIASLWPEHPAERGRHLLSDSIYRINQALGGDAIVASGDQLRVNPAVLGTDVGDFEAALAAGDRARAVEFYRGPLLDGFHLDGAADLDQWFSAERQRLADVCAGALEGLASAAEQRGEHTEAVRHWRRLAGLDPLSSRVALGLVAAMTAAGDRAAALQQAQVHGRLLREELGEEAAAEFRRAVDALPVLIAPTPRPAAPMATETAEPVVGTPAPPPLVRNPGEPTARWMRRLAAAVLLALGVLGVWAAWPARPVQGPVTLAVLPFTDLSAGGDQQYFADGMTEELITALAEVEGLRLATRTSVFALHEQGLELGALAERLGVAWVVEGSVRSDGGRLRIAVRLASAADGVQRWSDQYDRELADIFSVQEELARAIAGALRLRLVEGADLVAVPPASTEVYRLYLQGRYHWHERTEAGLRAAVAAFSEAVRLDPGYARAWLGLGDAYAVLGFYDWLPPHQAFPQARDAARRALAAPETRGDAEALLGYVELYYEWDFAAAARHFEVALRLEPGSSKVHQWHANYLTAVGRFAEAEAAMRQAQVLEPLSLIANAALCWSRYLAREFADAIAQCREARALDADFPLARLWEGWAWSALSQWDSASTVLAPLAARQGAGVLERAALAYARGGGGDVESARDLYAALRAERERGYVSAYELARAALGAGRLEEALDWLETAHADRSHPMVFLRWDAAMDRLRGTPRFEDLVRRVTGEVGAERAPGGGL